MRIRIRRLMRKLTFFNLFITQDSVLIKLVRVYINIHYIVSIINKLYFLIFT